MYVIVDLIPVEVILWSQKGVEVNSVGSILVDLNPVWYKYG